MDEKLILDNLIVDVPDDQFASVDDESVEERLIKRMTDPIQVVFSASRNLYPYLLMPIMSLLEHNPDAHVWLMLEDDRVPYDLPNNCTVVNVSRQTLFDPTGPNSRSPFTYLAMIRIVYALMFIGYPNSFGVESLPRLNKIISMDCDVIVCDTLQPIWDIDLGDKWYAAVPQYPSDTRPYGRQNIYRNAGVTIFNLDQMRRDSVSERAIDLLNRKKYTFIDEEVMNVLNMAEGDTKFYDLPPRYNEHLEVAQSIHPAVVHAAGVKYWWQNPEEQYRGSYWVPYMKYIREAECAAAGIKF